MTIILFGVFIALLLLGVPVAFSICSAAAVTMFTGYGDAKMMIIVQRMFASCDSFSLIAVPFFIFAGDLLANGKISKVLVEFCESLLGMIKGGLSVVSVLAGMFFAAISGSSPATTAAIGGIMAPEMQKNGYDEDFSLATAAAAGTLGQIIPPSVGMVSYAVLAEISVGTLFLTGFGPGILMAIMMMIYAHMYVKKNKNIVVNHQKVTVKEAVQTFFKSVWALVMPVIILGGIYGGIFTPTEAAVVAVVYCAGCIFFYNRFWPNTTIGGADVSMMGPSQAAAAIDEATRVQQVGVSGRELCAHR